MVLWSSEKPPPPRWPKTAVPLTVLAGQRKVRSGVGALRVPDGTARWPPVPHLPPDSTYLTRVLLTDARVGQS